MTSAWRPLSRKYSPIVHAGVRRDELQRRRTRTPSRRRRSCTPSRRAARACRRPARPSTASGRWRRRSRYTSPPFWLMIVSSAIAVLPVWRSPMMSSRWPRPIGIIASIALMPVCSGSFTGWRAMMPGALISMRRVSRRLDRALAVDRQAERVDDAAEQRLADRHLGDAAGALDRVAFLDALALRRRARRRRCPLRGSAPCRRRRAGTRAARRPSRLSRP